MLGWPEAVGQEAGSEFFSQALLKDPVGGDPHAKFTRDEIEGETVFGAEADSAALERSELGLKNMADVSQVVGDARILGPAVRGGLVANAVLRDDVAADAGGSWIREAGAAGTVVGGGEHLLPGSGQIGEQGLWIRGRVPSGDLPGWDEVSRWLELGGNCLGKGGGFRVGFRGGVVDGFGIDHEEGEIPEVHMTGISGDGEVIVKRIFRGGEGKTCRIDSRSSGRFFL